MIVWASTHEPCESWLKSILEALTFLLRDMESNEQAKQELTSTDDSGDTKGNFSLLSCKRTKCVNRS